MATATARVPVTSGTDGSHGKCVKLANCEELLAMIMAIRPRSSSLETRSLLDETPCW